MKRNLREPWLNKPNKYTPKGSATQELEHCLNWNSSCKRLSPQVRCQIVAGIFDELRELCFRHGANHSVSTVRSLSSVVDNLPESLVKCGLAEYVHPLYNDCTSDVHPLYNDCTVTVQMIRLRFADLEPCKNTENTYNQTNKQNALHPVQDKNNAPPLKKENKTQKDTSYLSVCKKEKNSDALPAPVEGREKSTSLSSEGHSENALNFEDGEASLFRDCLQDKTLSESELSLSDRGYLNLMYNQLCRLLGYSASAIADKQEGIHYILDYASETRAPIQDYFKIIGPNVNGITNAIRKLREYSQNEVCRKSHAACR